MNICWVTGFQQKSCSPSTGFTGPTFPASSECQWERGRCRTIQGNGRGQVEFLCVASSSSVLRVNAYLKTFSLNSPDESTSHWLLCQGHMSKLLNLSPNLRKRTFPILLKSTLWPLSIMPLPAPPEKTSILNFVLIVSLLFLLTVSVSIGHGFYLVLFWPLFFFKILFFLFLERGEGKKKERERNISVWLPFACPPTGDQACNPGMYPNWELNWRPFGSQACAQSTELHQPGPILTFISME